jgi:hypothetical protein
VETAARHEALNNPRLDAEPARLAVLRQLAEEDDALAAHGSGHTLGRLFIKAVGGRVHARAARGAAQGRCDALRSGRSGDEGQTAEQQGADCESLARAASAAGDRRDENRRDAWASGNS